MPCDSSFFTANFMQSFPCLIVLVEQMELLTTPKQKLKHAERLTQK